MMVSPFFFFCGNVEKSWTVKSPDSFHLFHGEMRQISTLKHGEKKGKLEMQLHLIV